jgi:hypothetical protein
MWACSLSSRYSFFAYRKATVLFLSKEHSVQRMQYPRKFGQGHISRERIDISPYCTVKGGIVQGGIVLRGIVQGLMYSDKLYRWY